MIKKSLYFGNPCYLSVKLKQLVVKMRETDEQRTLPIEDIGVVILDHPQITMTHEVIRSLSGNNAIVVSCNESHMPETYVQPLAGNTLMTKVFNAQVESSLPLKKQLWQQTVQAKIHNQAEVLKKLGKNAKRLEVLERNVQSGDSENAEGQAAAYYWQQMFGTDFFRDSEGEPPNNLLNYGYAILRSIVARSLVGSGLNLSLGIFHSNQYNAHCLTDDIMEPYRPFVDLLAYEIWQNNDLASFLDKETKARLLSIATVDVKMGNGSSPLMVGLVQTTASLAECFLGRKRKIKYPVIP